VASESRLQHFPDLVPDQILIAGDHVGFLLNQQCDVGVFLETVTNAIKMKVKTLLLQFLQAGENRRAVQARSNADGEQIGFGDSWRQHFRFVGILASESAE
jgi:hypothetical protein